MSAVTLRSCTTGDEGVFEPLPLAGVRIGWEADDTLPVVNRPAAGHEPFGPLLWFVLTVYDSLQLRLDKADRTTQTGSLCLILRAGVPYHSRLAVK